MPSYLDFDSTKQFRDFILGRTLTDPTGPQSFSADNYSVQRTRDMANVDPGDVEDTRSQELTKSATSNVFKPTEYSVKENLETIPRKANLSLYPYFQTDQDHSLVSIMSNQNFDNESELMKFAAWNIQNNTQGPFYGRMQSNLYRTTAGKVRLLDALDGNLATATNLLTGREPLVEGTSKITVAKTTIGKGIDFLQTVTGVEFPWSEIPGDYLTDPKNPIIARPEAASEAAKIGQDIAGGVGAMFGIQRRPLSTRKPSDLFIEYLGHRQKMTLYDNLSYLKYGPNYTTTARSQNSSKLFGVVDNFAQSARNFLGIEAPELSPYIGDDRGLTPSNSMIDFYDRPVKSTYYLGLLFDPIQTRAFQRTRNIGEGGGIAGKLTWISSNSKNKLGANNDEYSSEESQFVETLSTGYAFREDSILGLTQSILETMPSEGGAARGHVANVIDQTSRIFREDDQMLSRGSAIKYIDKFTGSESGVEYCRVWTKDRSYMNYSDTMKRTQNVRKFGSSVLDAPWNLNIYPNSNGNGAFDSSSTNMARGKGDGFYAKKYMFSIENLAWKTSNTPGFTYNDLPYCERGPNGGRVMWFPPYGLKVQEQNNANWEANTFLGRPEPVYTYQNAQRNGTISFKVVVDHPSILNLLVKDAFQGMSDEESDNAINAFFAGCQDIDFYSLIRKYTTLNQDEVKKIQAYLNGNKDPNTVTQYKTVIRPAPDKPVPDNGSVTQSVESSLYFKNDYPDPRSTSITTESEYGTLKSEYESYQSDYIAEFETGYATIEAAGWTPIQRNNYKALTGLDLPTRPDAADIAATKAKCISQINDGFTQLNTNYTAFTNGLSALKTGLENKTVKDVTIRLQSRTSSVADDYYNLYLAYRRSYSIIKDIVSKISSSTANATEVMSKLLWPEPPVGTKQDVVKPSPIKLKLFGHESEGNFNIEYVSNVGEQEIGTTQSGTKNVDCTDKYKILGSDELKRTAPITFWCRETSAVLKYDVGSPDEKTPPVSEEPTVEIVNNTIQTTMPSPPIDEMKKIIMKTLSECYYFKKLEEESPTQFASLREKLKYFHPSFHSITPEGLNSRLTFLQQCLRPGETIPIKGLSDASDLNARNTTFGPPPICVMRIGDFYHSKVAIRDINIEFDEDLWDMNPEGIGVQPMIANVTMQIYFIGGHGLQKPVERLQNALSSNFYANTEMYDPRSISTETTIAGQDASKFTKEFLENIVKDTTEPQNTTAQETPPTEDQVVNGEYIGDVVSSTLYYDSLVNRFYDRTIQYYNAFRYAYNDIVEKYGDSLASIILSPTYRSIKDYTVQTGSGTQTIQLLGEYPKGNDFEVLRRTFKAQILAKIAEENISTIFEFNKDLTAPVLRRSEELLNPYIRKRIGEIIDGMSQATIKDIEEKRNEVIYLLDNLNFIIETGHDGSINGETYTGVNFSGYTYDQLYGIYSNVITYITQAEPLFNEDLDTTSYVFSNSTTMTTANLTMFLKDLLNSPKEIQGILDVYNQDQTVFTTRIRGDIEKRIKRFMPAPPTDKDFSSVVPRKAPVRKNDNEISFGIANTDYEFTTDEKAKLKSVFTLSPNKTTSVLNYYR